MFFIRNCQRACLHVLINRSKATKSLRLKNFIWFTLKLVLILLVLHTSWKFIGLITHQWGNYSYNQLGYLNLPDKTSIHTISNVGEAISEIWPVYLSKNILPKKDMTMLWFGSQPPFYHTQTKTSYYDKSLNERKQMLTVLTSALHGLIKRLIWIYPNWKQSSRNRFYNKTYYRIGLTRITFSQDLNQSSNLNFPTICLCKISETQCTLPLLLPSDLYIDPQSCSLNSSLIYEELVDVLSESILIENPNLNQDNLKSPDFINTIYSQFNDEHSMKTWIQHPLVVFINLDYFLYNENKFSNLDDISLLNYNHTYPKYITEYLDYVNTMYTKLITHESYKPDQSLIKLKSVLKELLIRAPVTNQLTIIMMYMMTMTNETRTNKAITSHPSCGDYLIDSSISLNSLNEWNSYRDWRNNLLFAHNDSEKYCLNMESILYIITDTSLVSYSIKNTVLQLWQWLCQLNPDQLEFLSKFTACLHSPNDYVDLCVLRYPNSTKNTNNLPQLNSLLFGRLSSIFNRLPRPNLITLINSTTGQSNLDNEICFALNQTFGVLSEQTNKHQEKG